MSLNTRQIFALLSLPGIGPKTILKIGNSTNDTIEDSNLFDLICRFRKISFNATVVKQNLSEASRTLKILSEKGIGLMSFYEPSFPESFRKAVDSEGRDAPSVLIFYRGDISLMNTNNVAIIGSRNALPQALKASNYLAEEISRRGCSIVSGLALGCDYEAHLGALQAANGKTVAILGNGFDHISPMTHRILADRILSEGGLLVSEYAPATRASKATFVARDRLQAAMANVVVVVQTAIDGGSMHAAKAAWQQGKPLYVARYSNPNTNNSKEMEGNQYLALNFNAQYIGGHGSLTEITNSIEEIVTKASPQNNPIQDALFHF